MGIEPPELLRVTTRTTADGLEVAVWGDLDIEGAPRLVDALPSAPTAALTLCLDGVSFMDSTGLRVLLEARATQREAGQALTLRAPSAAVMRVLELVDLQDEFQIDPAGPTV